MQTPTCRAPHFWFLALLCMLLPLLHCQSRNTPCESREDCGTNAICYLPLKRCLPFNSDPDAGPLPPTPDSSTKEQSGACQQHTCTADATRCTTSGWLSRCVTHTVSGCRVWTPAAPCPQGLRCEPRDGKAACKNNSPYEIELQLCADEINKYRKSIQRTPLTRDPSLEAYAARAVEHDAKDAKPHSYFNSTKGGGISRAENEIPGWPKSKYGSIKKVIELGTEMMYNEGPGGGHHDNIVNPQFTKVGCGILVTPQGEIWIAQEFR